MLMNDKIIFDRYYCISSPQTKEIMVHYSLQPCHIFICVKAFILVLVPGGVQILIIRCFAWRLVTNINKCDVFTARVHANCHIKTQHFSSLIYA